MSYYKIDGVIHKDNAYSPHVWEFIPRKEQSARVQEVPPEHVLYELTKQGKKKS